MQNSTLCIVLSKVDGQDSPLVVAKERLHPPADMVSVEVNKFSESDFTTLDLCEGTSITWQEKMKTLATVGKANPF